MSTVHVQTHLGSTSPTRGWSTGILPNTSPQHSLTLQGHSSFALSLCCAGRRTLSKKWMCCSLPGSPPSLQWRTLTSQTGLERCRKDGELACVAEKKVNLSEIMMLQCYLVRVVKYRNQLPRQGMDSPALQRFKATLHSPGEPGQMRPALIRAEPHNFWKSFQLQLLSDNHFNNVYNTQQHHLAVGGSPTLQIYSPNTFCFAVSKPVGFHQTQISSLAFTLVTLFCFLLSFHQICLHCFSNLNFTNFFP